MLSREFRKVYHPSLGRFVYEHRGNGLIVDNIMKPLKAAVSTAANKAGRAVAKAIGKKASKTAKAASKKAAKAVAEKSGDIIRKRLNRFSLGQAPSPRPQRGLSQAEAKPPLSRKKKQDAKMTRNEVNTLINNLIARS